MGSFTSTHKITNDDTADNDLDLPKVNSVEELLSRCQEELAYHPPQIERAFHFVNGSPGYEVKGQERRIRVMQWNVLSQALALGSDNFVACPPEALAWSTRRWRLLEEILTVHPDILCLQEVDHYQFLKRTLGSLGFRGIFFPKPDSPCYYIVGNNGPDGCAVYYDAEKYELLSAKTRVLEVWGYQSNQVVILCHFRRKWDEAEFCVATTHLKARQGALMATMRNEQGRDLMEFLKLNCSGRPVILTGDFNAEPSERVYWTLSNDEKFRLDSAYRWLTNRHTEPPYTTWKIREEGDCCQTLDYIFFSRDSFTSEAVQHLPTVEDIGEGRVPSYRYPSDHFSLVADLRMNSNDDA